MAFTLLIAKARHCAKDFKQGHAQSLDAIILVQRIPQKVTNVQNVSALPMVPTPAQNPLLLQVKHGKTEKEKAKAKARKEKAKGSGGESHHLIMMIIQSLSLSE